jgi:uncharacterized protein (TIGR03000 family)
MSVVRRIGFLLIGLMGIACLGLPALHAAEPGTKKEKPAVQSKDGAGKARGTLRILLPAEAKLKIDDVLTKSKGAERTFTTPLLDKTKTFTYTLKWTYPEEGRTITRMIVVQFQPGKTTIVDLRPGSKANTSSKIIYVPTSQNIVDEMLAMAKVTAKDVVYDLGCGDARILVTAATKYGARGVGIDIDPERIKDSLENVKKNKVGKLVEIRQGDALDVADISKATVVTLYMLREFQIRLAPILKRKLKPGTRVVAHDFPLPGWKEDSRVDVEGMFLPHVLYLYRVKAEKKE